MNSKTKQQAKLSNNAKDCTQQNRNSLKRPREEDAVVQNNTNNKMPKRRQPKTLFRPWCDTESNQAAKELANIQKDAAANKPLSTAAFPLTPYQMAVHQQRYQTAMALQQAYYQRQLIVNHIWAQQQQQMLMYQQQQMQQQQQQLYMFGQQQGMINKN